MKTTKEYPSQYTADRAQLFAKNHQYQNTRILIYRDIEMLLKKYLSEGTALDFGCGAGASARYLANLGFNVTGVDINKEMILNAFDKPDGIPFGWIKHGKLPFGNKTFDLVQALMVLMEEPSLDFMAQSLGEIWRVLKPNGIFLAVVPSDHLHKHNWVNRLIIDVENNRDLKTGDVYTTFSPGSNMTFNNFVYFDSDYQSLFYKTNFRIVEIHKALGKDTDNINWQLEISLNPFTHYLCQKS